MVTSKAEQRAGVVEAIEAAGLVAVLRRVPAPALLKTVRVLVGAGVRVIELTWDGEDTPDRVADVERAFGSRVLLGAGTILERRHLEAVARAGARFVVSPVFRREVVETGRVRGIVTIPGAFTPTEILEAWSAGGDLVKVFPACAVGPSYFRELAGPLPEVPLLAVGGITSATAGDYLAAGARAVAAGGALVPMELVRNERWEDLADVAGQFVAAIESWQRSRPVRQLDNRRAVP